MCSPMQIYIISINIPFFVIHNDSKYVKCLICAGTLAAPLHACIVCNVCLASNNELLSCSILGPPAHGPIMAQQGVINHVGCSSSGFHRERKVRHGRVSAGFFMKPSNCAYVKPLVYAPKISTPSCNVASCWSPALRVFFGSVSICQTIHQAVPSANN